jgi:protein-tyrosine-phosphatase/N-acetylglutamate synthase-like GNAT family acetyltransferase
MDIVTAIASDEQPIRCLLESSGLLIADLAGAWLEHFLVLREGQTLAGVVGLEPIGQMALLRSLAVAETLRGTGIGRALVAAAEQRARARGVHDLFLLTTSAGHFFSSLGYRELPRESAPAAIRATPQFKDLCPSTSHFMAKSMTTKTFNVLFLCTGNSARSIMAEAAMNHLPVGGGGFRAFSAGSKPSGAPNPFALELLSRQGIATDGLRSKSWDEFAAPGAPQMDFIFTVCDNAAGEVCPYWPGQPMTAHWGVPDPAAAQGSDEHRRRAFLDAFLTLRRRIELFASLPFDKLDQLALRERLRGIGST